LQRRAEDTFLLFNKKSLFDIGVKCELYLKINRRGDGVRLLIVSELQGLITPTLRNEGRSFLFARSDSEVLVCMRHG